jgi:hypothetical protein
MTPPRTRWQQHWAHARADRRRMVTAPRHDEVVERFDEAQQRAHALAEQPK